MAKKKNKKLKINNILTIISILASIYLIYNILLLKSIETTLRYIVIFIIILIDIYFYRKNIKNKKNKFLYNFFIILFITINIFIGNTISNIYKNIDNINKDKITYSSYLISLSKSDISNIDDCINKKIGLLDKKENIDNYIIPNEMIEQEKLNDDNQIIKYDDLNDMIKDLYNEKIDLMFVSSNYISMFSNNENYENIGSETKIVLKNEKTVNKEKTNEEKENGKNVKDSFTILLMGVDSEKDGLDSSSSNGDSLILITFNPSTLNATMLSIPRDSYVPITCFKNKRENKLTHAAWYGSSCMIDTIENFLDINIDYYVKINFKGVVSLVNELGGINADVPRDLCTDSSDRTGEVCIKGGNQNLDGEGALVLARNRYDLPNGDFDRSKNQQVLLKAILNKMKTIRSTTKFNNILSTISKNMDTNLTTDQILSFYSIFKDIVKLNRINKDVVNIERLYLSGSGQMIYDEYSKITMWNYILNKESIGQVSNEMKKNLEKNTELIKEFNYLVKDGYKEEVIGTHVHETTKYTLLPNFIGKNKSDVEKFIKENKVKVKVKYIYKEDNTSNNRTDTVLKQNYNKNTRIDKIDTLEITLLKNTNKKAKISCKDNNNDECLLPSLIGLTKDEVTAYFNKYEDNIKITYKEVDKNLYKNKKSNTIVAQNYKVNTHLLKINNLELTIIK